MVEFVLGYWIESVCICPVRITITESARIRFIIYRNSRRHHDEVGPRVSRQIAGPRFCEEEILPILEDALAAGSIHAESHLLEPGVFESSVVVDGSVIVHRLASSGKGNIVILDCCSAEHLSLPIRICVVMVLKSFHAADTREYGILVGHVVILPVCLGIHKVVARKPVDLHASVELYLEVSCLSLLGGDDDNAAGRTRTVYCRGGCILQHLDGLNVLHVETEFAAAV